MKNKANANFQKFDLYALSGGGRRGSYYKTRTNILLVDENYPDFISALTQEMVDRGVCDAEANMDVSVTLIAQDLE